MTHRQFAFGALCLLGFLIIISGQTAVSRSSLMADGIGYLKSTQNTDGSWGGTPTALNDTFPSTATALAALRALETSGSTNQINAINLLAGQPVDENRYLASRIFALNGTGVSTTADLSVLFSRQNSDGGWGAGDGFESNPLDTSFTLLALKAVSVTNNDAVISGLSYLVRTQNSDGGWSLTAGEDSQIFYSAYALQALNSFRLQFPFLISAGQPRALAYLRGKQNADGGYGSPASTPFETAVSLLAINGSGLPSTPAEALAVNYLNSTQQVNGSWVDDAYSTALALLALSPTPDPGAGNHPPVITSQPVTTAREGQVYSYQVQASDADSDPLSFAFLKSPGGMTISVTGLINWTPSAGQSGNIVVIVKVSDNKGGSTLQEYTINVLAIGIDLTVVDVDTSGVTTDTQTLVIGGAVRVQMQNKGGSAFDGSFNVLLFEDRNNNGTYQRGVDNLLGVERFNGTIASTAAAALNVRVSGVVQFRDDVILAFVDSTNEIIELDETNNIGNSAQASKYHPPVGDFQPKTKWEKNIPGDVGQAEPPIVAPLIDTNGDGLINERDIPAVIFVTTIDASGHHGPNKPTALRGDTGEVIFAGDDTGPIELGSFGRGVAPAIGDIDGDGKPEIIAQALSGPVLYCFNNDGTLKWTSARVQFASDIILADLDGDGKSEIIFGATVFNFDGTTRWNRDGESRGDIASSDFGGRRQVVDLDLDGKPEIVVGSSAYDREGTPLWYWTQPFNPGLLPAFTTTGVLKGGETQTIITNAVLANPKLAVANIDDDPYPEIIAISSLGGNSFGAGVVYHSMWIFQHDGRITASPFNLFPNEPAEEFPYEVSAPIIADFDGDGKPDVAISVSSRISSNGGTFATGVSRRSVCVFRTDGTLIWRRYVISDSNEQADPAVAAFDFDGDGAVEAVYQDSQRLYILNGHDGTSLYELAVNQVSDPTGSTRYATIADVDNDGNAEIIVPTSNSFPASAHPRSGILVIGDTKDNWFNARRVWNQWQYNITNINDDASVPRVARNNWQIFNNQHTQIPIEGLDQFAAPDITVSKVTVSSQDCPASLGITARIGNGGSLHVPKGVTAKFYTGDPVAGGTLIGTVQTTKALYPGEYEDVRLAWNGPTPGQVFVTANEPPDEGLVQSGNLVQSLPDTWAQSSGLACPDNGCIVANNFRAYNGIDGNQFTLWREANGGTLYRTGLAFYEVRFPFPVNATSVTVQNNSGSSSTTAFLGGTLSFSNGVTAPITFDANGEGTASFAEQQNVSWVRLTASSTPPGGASLSEFIVGGSYREPQFRINEGAGRSGNNKAAFAPFTASPCAGENQPPQIVSAPVITGDAGVAYNYQIQAIDPNNDQLSFSLATGPSGMSVSAAGLLGWTPTSAQTGDSPVTVQVSDGRGGSAQQSFSIRVPEAPTPNRAPQITSSAPASVLIGQTYQYDVNALDADGDTIIFALLQAPAGASIDQFVGRLVWTPNLSQSAAQLFVVEAQDGRGGRTTQSFFVDVLAPPETPPPTTLPSGTVTCSLVTDKRGYASNSLAQLTVQLQNLSGTLDVLNLQAMLTVTDPGSQTIFNTTLPVNTLSPKALFKGTSPFSTGTKAPGAYRANLDLRYGQQSVCTAQANFNIFSSAGQGTALEGTISSTPAVVEKPGSAAFNYRVSNIGNVDLAQLDLKVLLVDLASGTAVQTFSDQTSLTRDQSFSNTKSLSSTAAAAGDFLVVLQGTSGGATQTISSTPLRINKSTFHLDAAGYTVTEGCGAAIITVRRTGDASDAATVDFNSGDGTALQRTDYSIASGSINFASGETSKTFKVLVNEDGYAEGNETVSINLTNATNGSGIGIDGSATLTVIDNDAAASTTNPIDEAGLFVCQHYHDFLAREADAVGADYWTNQITQCGSDPECIRNKRIDVSNAFYFEQEFQQTGSYVYRLYRAAYGNSQPFPNSDKSNATEANKVPSYLVFARDRARVVGGASLAQGQQDLANLFVLRPEFLARYPASLDGPSFIDAVLNSIKNDLNVDLTVQKPGLLTLFNSGGRGAVLYRLADDDVQTNPINNRVLIDAEYNRAFVATQYFGYLRRDPDIGGFLFWFGQVNSAPLRDVPKQHAMVCSFITSTEYQQRFSSVVTRSNADCSQ